MNSEKTDSFWKAFASVSFLIMVAVNGLANALPINGIQTGQVSDAYPNLFAPAGVTFAIWGVIYLLLALYTLYQYGVLREQGSKEAEVREDRVRRLFAISSAANTAWIFAWHYRMIALSLGLIVSILICLILVNLELSGHLLSGRQRFFLRLPFSIYFGWITVAAIANATTLLVDLQWRRFGLPEEAWTVIILLTGMLIGLVTMLRNRNGAYGLVLIWAYSGILLKHISATGFSGQYTAVIYTALFCILFYIAGEVWLLRKFRKEAW